MQRIIAISAAILGVASAAPYPAEPETFSLRAELTDPAKDLTPSVQGLYLSYERVGQGVNIAVAKSDPTVFSRKEAEGGATIVHDTPVYPLSLFAQGPNDFDASYPEEHNVGLLVNDATRGLNVSPHLTGPGAGTYLICYRQVTFPSGPAQLPLPRFLHDHETIPDGCVAVNFKPE